MNELIKCTWLSTKGPRCGEGAKTLNHWTSIELSVAILMLLLAFCIWEKNWNKDNQYERNRKWKEPVKRTDPPKSLWMFASQ